MEKGRLASVDGQARIIGALLVQNGTQYVMDKEGNVIALSELRESIGPMTERVKSLVAQTEQIQKGLANAYDRLNDLETLRARYGDRGLLKETFHIAADRSAAWRMSSLRTEAATLADTSDLLSQLVDEGSADIAFSLFRESTRTEKALSQSLAGLASGLAGFEEATTSLKTNFEILNRIAANATEYNLTRLDDSKILTKAAEAFYSARQTILKSPLTTRVVARELGKTGEGFKALLSRGIDRQWADRESRNAINTAPPVKVRPTPALDWLIHPVRT
ncbi:MAG TPA: hypothetical protein PK362_12205, partial [Elusimicrobiota bacterium]|nr:hypothetical protein [Elusimicrobiota bacterium]